MIDELRTAGASAKDPSSYSWLTYAWVIFLSVWGGVVRVMRELKVSDKTLRQLVWIFVTEMLTSGFVGIVTFFLAEAAEIRPLYCAALCSIAGWMGVQAIPFLKAIYRNATSVKA